MKGSGRAARGWRVSMRRRVSRRSGVRRQGRAGQWAMGFASCDGSIGTR